MAIRQLKDGRVLVIFLTPDGPAQAAFEAEIGSGRDLLLESAVAELQ